jgi:hypothetical protein
MEPDRARARKRPGKRRVGRATDAVWTTKRVRPLEMGELILWIVVRAREEDRIYGARPGASPQKGFARLVG